MTGSSRDIMNRKQIITYIPKSGLKKETIQKQVLKPVEKEVFIPRKGEAQDVDVSKWIEIISNPSLSKSTLSKVYRRIFNGENELAETLKIFVLEEKRHNLKVKLINPMFYVHSEMYFANICDCRLEENPVEGTCFFHVASRYIREISNRKFARWEKMLKNFIINLFLRLRPCHVEYWSDYMRNINMSDEIDIEKDRPGQFAFKLKCAILNGVRVDRELLARGEAIASLQESWNSTEVEGADLVWGRLKTEHFNFKRNKPKKSKNAMMKKVQSDARRDVTVWAQKAISNSFRSRSNLRQ
ncbi:hypothetical protein B9Z55_025284 [Caenorhabditis nigoni]|uniref:Uncharacterized protein n=1 Tax=Caenorhabditis nigoni TaxID=1611254 RepID=A0A2G5SXQ6_9PELO|nr:hypothetical protein B9Z55_025284 [Caenorhabditis nigoni]